MALHRFYWLVPDRLAGCSRPGGSPASAGNRESDANQSRQRLGDDLAWLRGQGVGAVLTLTETALGAKALEEQGLEVLHLPVPDMHAPHPEDFAAALEFIDRQLVAGHPVAVHCLAGQGRTGTILAAYLIRGGIESGEAIERVRALCPGAIESPAQREALDDFARRRDWVV